MEHVRFEVSDHIALVTLDRPEALNAQNEAFLREFLEVTSGLTDRDDFDVVTIRSSSDHFGAAWPRGGSQWVIVDQVVPVGGMEAAWEELVAPLNADNLPSCGESKRIITTSLETPHDRALADFLETQARLFASATAETRLSQAVDLFRSGGHPSLDAGWFPLGRPEVN
jgi:enoyl-CoA hydratase/carnithine racemase